MDLADPGAFEHQVAELKRMGLNETSLSQIAQAGAGDGMPIAEDIITGGAETVRLLNSLQDKVRQAARQVVTVHVQGGVSGKSLAAEMQRQLLGMRQRNFRLRPWT